jgi:uncharacterized damage-inducible protein DinB
MSELIKMQFELTRSNLFKSIEESNEGIFDVQPEGFNNTIHWHIGHILTVGEQFLFGAEGTLPPRYGELFGYGTRPSEWSGEVPIVESLVEELKNQLSRIKEIPEERFANSLPKRILGRETYGQLAGLAAYHEAFHYGQIHAMKRLVENSIK